MTVGLLIGGRWDCPTAMAGKSSSLMDISADGKLLVCTNRDNGTVSVIDLQSHQKLREIPLGAKPEGVTFLGNSHLAAAAVYAEDKIVFFDADSGKQLGATEVFDEPYGIVSDSAGGKVFVTLDYPGQIVEIDVKSRKVTRTFPAGHFSRGLALSTDDRRLYVTEFYTGLVRAFDARSGKQTDQWAGASTENLARQIVLHPTRPKAYLPHIRSRVTAVHGEGSIFPYITVIDTDEKKRNVAANGFRWTRSSTTW
ncbi:MAG: YncE family protein [Planctomycetes bacterium]|nr:YncE family protein [Planctomycetota bacterium]